MVVHGISRTLASTHLVWKLAHAGAPKLLDDPAQIGGIAIRGTPHDCSSIAPPTSVVEVFGERCDAQQSRRALKPRSRRLSQTQPGKKSRQRQRPRAADARNVLPEVAIDEYE